MRVVTLKRNVSTDLLTCLSPCKSFWAQWHHLTDTQVIIPLFGPYVKLVLKPGALPLPVLMICYVLSSLEMQYMNKVAPETRPAVWKVGQYVTPTYYSRLQIRKWLIQYSPMWHEQKSASAMNCPCTSSSYCCTNIKKRYKGLCLLLSWQWLTLCWLDLEKDLN